MSKPTDAIADGASHQLRERFKTLEEAQRVFPHARSLDDEIDWCAAQAQHDRARAAQPPIRVDVRTSGDLAGILDGRRDEIGLCGLCGQLGPAGERCRRKDCLRHRSAALCLHPMDCVICRAWMKGEKPGGLEVLFKRAKWVIGP